MKNSIVFYSLLLLWQWSILSVPLYGSSSTFQSSNPILSINDELYDSSSSIEISRCETPLTFELSGLSGLNKANIQFTVPDGIIASRSVINRQPIVDDILRLDAVFTADCSFSAGEITLDVTDNEGLNLFSQNISVRNTTPNNPGGSLTASRLDIMNGQGNFLYTFPIDGANANTKKLARTTIDDVSIRNYSFVNTATSPFSGDIVFMDTLFRKTGAYVEFSDPSTLPNLVTSATATITELSAPRWNATKTGVIYHMRVLNLMKDDSIVVSTTVKETTCLADRYNKLLRYTRASMTVETNDNEGTGCNCTNALSKLFVETRDATKKPNLTLERIHTLDCDGPELKHIYKLTVSNTSANYIEMQLAKYNPNGLSSYDNVKFWDAYPTFGNQPTSIDTDYTGLVSNSQGLTIKRFIAKKPDGFTDGEVLYLTIDETVACPSIDDMTKPINTQLIHRGRFYIVASNGNSCVGRGKTVYFPIQRFGLSQYLSNSKGTLGNTAATTISIQNTTPLLIHDPLEVSAEPYLRFDPINSSIEIDLKMDPGLVFKDLTPDMFDLVDGMNPSSRISPTAFFINGVARTPVQFWNEIPELETSNGSGTEDNCPARNSETGYSEPSINCDVHITLRYDLAAVTPSLFGKSSKGYHIVTDEFKDFFDNFKLEFDVAGCCTCYNAGGGNDKAVISQSFHFIKDVTCENYCRIPLSEASDEIIINCPGCIVPGWNIENMTVERSPSSIGWEDADNNSYPDLMPSGSNNFNTNLAQNPNKNRMIVGDEIIVYVKGKISDGDAIDGFTFAQLGNNNFFKFGEFLLTGPLVGHLELMSITGDYTQNNSSYNINVSIPNTAGNIQLPASIRHDNSFQMMLDASDMASMLSPSVQNFRYRANDEIKLKLVFKIKDNLVNSPSGGGLLMEQMDVSGELNISGTDFGWRDNRNRPIDTVEPEAGLLPYAMSEFGATKPSRELWSSYYYFCTGYETRVTGVGVTTSSSFEKVYPSYYTIPDGRVGRNICRSVMVHKTVTLAGKEFKNKGSVAIDPFPSELRNFWMLEEVNLDLPTGYDIDIASSGIRNNALDATGGAYKVNMDVSTSFYTPYITRIMNLDSGNASATGNSLNIKTILDSEDARLTNNYTNLTPEVGTNLDRSAYGESKGHATIIRMQRQGCPDKLPLQDPQILKLTPTYEAGSQPIELASELNLNFIDQFNEPNIRMGHTVKGVSDGQVNLNLVMSSASVRGGIYAPYGFISIASDDVNIISSELKQLRYGGSGYQMVERDDNGIFHAPDLTAGDNFNTFINFDCSALSPGATKATFYVYYGYNCTDYVTSLDDACGLDSTVIEVILDQVGINEGYRVLDAEINEIVKEVTACEKAFYEIELDAIGGGLVSNALTTSSFPQGITFDPNDGITYEYPKGTINVMDAADIEWMAADGKLKLDMKDNLAGFVGLDENRTRVIIRVPITFGCDYKGGDIQSDVIATNFCGRPLTVGTISPFAMPSMLPNPECCGNEPEPCTAKAKFDYIIDEKCNIIINNLSTDSENYIWLVTEDGRKLETSTSANPSFSFTGPFPKRLSIRLTVNEDTDCQDTWEIPVFLNCCTNDEEEPCENISFGIKSSTFDLEECTYEYVLSRSANFPNSCKSVFEVLDDEGNIVESFVANSSETTLGFVPEKPGYYTVKLSVICGEGRDKYVCEAKSYSFCFEGCDTPTDKDDMKVKSGEARIGKM